MLSNVDLIPAIEENPEHENKAGYGQVLNILSTPVLHDLYLSTVADISFSPYKSQCVTRSNPQII